MPPLNLQHSVTLQTLNQPMVSQNQDSNSVKCRTSANSGKIGQLLNLKQQQSQAALSKQLQQDRLLQLQPLPTTDFVLEQQDESGSGIYLASTIPNDSVAYLTENRTITLQTTEQEDGNLEKQSPFFNENEN